PGVLKAVEEGIVQISSTHNFCPLPTGINQAAPNVYEPSARFHQEHEQWLRYTRRSIDFAAQVRARVLVMHLGRVPFVWRNPARALQKYVEKHPSADLLVDENYCRTRPRARASLCKKAVIYLAQRQASSANVPPYAAEKTVRHRLDNREAFN